MQNKRGSIVAIEPSTGEILAFVSSPSFDPDLLVGRYHTENYEMLKNDTLLPLFDRPLMARYPPGSTFKTINALEYVIYKKSVNAEKEREMAGIAAASITKKLASLVDIYEKARPEIANNEAKFNAVLLNQLGVSSYELKEWRVGEATGLSKKYKDNPDMKKAEFHLSGLSVKAISAILEAHVQVMENKVVPNFGDKAIEYGASNDVALIRTSITSAQSAIKEMNNSLMNGANKKLYGSLGKLHNGYYVSLISTLRMTSKLLDADGD